MSETGEIAAEVSTESETSTKESKVLPAREGIKKAQEFFTGEDFSIGAIGCLQPPFAPDQLNKLKTIVDSNTEQSLGVLMPTEDVFYQDVLLGVSIWPQV